MRILILLPLVSLLAAPLAEAQLAQEQERAIDRLFTSFDADTVPGCVAGVMRDGQLLFARGYGAADLSSGTRLTPRTRIGIASLTKQFTAAVIALLVEQGRIDLDTDVRRFIPELPQYGTPIRIRHLLFHTSGLRDYLSMVELQGGDPEGPIPDAEILRLIARQHGTNHAPGTAHAYSNTNYYLLGEIVRRVEGTGLREFATRQLFGRLGMQETTYALAGETLSRRAESYRMDGDRLVEVRMAGNIAGDGGVYTTLEDLARWDAHFVRPSLSGDPASYIRLITMNGALDDGRTTGYGWGNQFATYRGLETQGHGGTWGGYRVQYLRFPSERISLAVLCNQLEISPFQLVRRLADIVLVGRLGETADPTAGPPVTRSAPAAAPTRVDSATASRFVGEYWSSELDARYRIVLDSQYLRLRVATREEILLRVVHTDTLASGARTLAMHRDGAGMTTGLTLSTGRVRGVHFERVDGQPPSMIIPRGRFVTVDGRNDFTEWSDATEVLIRVDSDWAVSARLKHDGDNLLLAFFNLRSGIVRVPEVLIDTRNDKGSAWRADDWWFHASATDCASSGRFNDYSTCVAEGPDWTATNVRGMTIPEVMEIRIPMRLLGVAPGDTVGLALDVTDTRTTWNFWPRTAQMAAPGSWANALIRP